MKKKIKMNNIIYRDIYFKYKWTLFSSLVRKAIYLNYMKQNLYLGKIDPYFFMLVKLKNMGSIFYVGKLYSYF